MSIRGMPSDSTGRSAKRASSLEAARTAKPLKDATTKPLRLRPTSQQQKNGNGDFDPEAFLAQTGVGRTVLSLKKNEDGLRPRRPGRRNFLCAEGQTEGNGQFRNWKRSDDHTGGRRGISGRGVHGLRLIPLRLATATAMTECEVLRISKAEMVRVLHQEHALSDVFVSFLLSRNARIQADLVDQLFNSSEKRLARTLLLLAQFGKESKPETVVPKISQEMLAEMIGTTRSRVSFFMNRFRKLGFIEYNGEIRVHNSLLNIFLQE